MSRLILRFPDGDLGKDLLLGHTTSRSVRVWYRDPAMEPAAATLTVDGSQGAYAPLIPDPEHDGIAYADLAVPGDVARRPFTVDAGGLQRSAVFAPMEDTPAAFSFAFGSCHQPYVLTDGKPADGEPGVLATTKAAGIYPVMDEALRQAEARFVMLVGDQVYSDAFKKSSLREWAHKENPSHEDMLEAYRKVYHGYLNEAGFRRLLEHQPTYMTWDDHDIFDGWGSLPIPDECEERLYTAAEIVYREFQNLHNPQSALDDPAPHHYCYWYGNCGFFVFDLRSRRDFAEGKLLGTRQLKDFMAFLRECEERKTPTIFLGSGIPMVHFSPNGIRMLEWIPGGLGTDIRDRWSTTPLKEERDGVLTAIFDWQCAAPERQVIVLSGDVHVAAAFTMRRRRGGPGLLHQWTSSALTTPAPLPHRLANRIGSRLVNWGDPEYTTERLGIEVRNNFGLVTVRPHEGGHDVELTINAFDQESNRLVPAIRATANRQH